MPNRFFDTSALGKRYHAELGTDTVNQRIAEAGFVPIISRLSLVEMQSVFAGKVRTGVIATVEFELLRRRFLTDVCRRVVRVARIAGFHFQEAERLVRQRGITGSLRTLDAVQLAVALDLQQREGLAEFVCSDKRLCQLAAAEGLAVLNPEQP
jgi:predicted nucleic acid-binding protein